jgi:hypothetical protein
MSSSAPTAPAAAAHSGTTRLVFVAGNPERRQFIADHPEAVLISARLPLRANLSVLENIAVVPQFRDGMDARRAGDHAWALLELVGRTGCAQQRDPDLDHEERFLVKLLRAIALAPPIILIDRPGRLLPDTHYPPFLRGTLAALEGRFEQCWIVDYEWNAPLYRHPESGT